MRKEKTVIPKRKLAAVGFGRAIGWPLAVFSCSLFAAAAPSTAVAQNSAPAVGTDTVTVIAGIDYAAGGFHRSMLGNDYRDAWTTPIRVPVLNLRTFAGGVSPTKLGGGFQAKSLHLVTRDSSDYVFRPVHKTMVVLPKQYEGTVIWSIFRDQGSSSHPTAAAAAAPMLGAVGILHPNPILVVMPDDPILGEFRKEFAGVLGWIEEFPTKPKDAPGFADANEIIDSEDLLDKLNKDPKNQVDAREFLTATLMDLIFGDNDRHPGQWKWARLGKGDDSPWEPIPRDRDKVFVTYEGKLLSLARLALPNLVRFERTYPAPSGVFANAMDFDRRMLATLDKSVWDSVATSITRSLTDPIIESAVGEMPKPYEPSSRVIAGKLKARRDHLREAADIYYQTLWDVAEIHATDSDDRATIVRSGDGLVDVSIQSGTKAPWFKRLFDARETREIRVYLHGGNDFAIVTGNPSRSILVRIIGGNGNNTLVDTSVINGHRHPTRLYDTGNVQDVKYAADSADIKANVDNALNHSFNRRPWVRAYGTLIPPVKDRGSSIQPTAGLRTGRGLGLVGRVGLARYVYGFRTVPYASMMRADVAYATTNRFAFDIGMDKRVEGSSVHVPAEAGATQMEVVQFHGFGNDIPDLRGKFYEVKETQYHFYPAIGFSFNPESEISLGPVVRYTSTDSVGNRFISQTRPYGFGNFGEAGLQLRLHYDTRTVPDTVKPRAVFDIVGSGYPAMWDAKSAYESLAGVASAYFTVPVATLPVLAFRAGGKKLFGDFPFFDAAFLGGSSSLRTEDRQRFAGDESIYGSSELRVPIAKFPLILPLDVGALGFVDTGRVYLNGESPGGWHSAAGGGFWVGFLNPGTSVNVLFTNNSRHRIVSNIGFAF